MFKISMMLLAQLYAETRPPVIWTGKTLVDG